MMGMMGQGGGMMGDGMSDMMPMMSMMRMMGSGAHIDGRLAFLKAELKISQAQEQVWSDFAGAARQAALKLREVQADGPRMAGTPGNMTPPQHLERHERRLAARLEAIRLVKPALTSLYAALGDEQKQTLAQLHPMLAGMM